MKKFKLRKKGNVIYLFIICFIALSAVAGMIFNMAYSISIVNRVMFATSEAAKMRSQAVDIRLKEQEGIVELFHYEYEDLEDVENDIEHDKIVSNDSHKKILDFDSNEYSEKVRQADDATKQAAMEIINSGLGLKSDGSNIIDIEERNICIDIRPIPEKAGVITFSCTAVAGGEQFAFEYSYIVTSGQIHTFKELQVKNAVMVGIAVEYRNFIEIGLDRLGLNVSPKFAHYEISFPEVDVCSRVVNEIANNNPGNQICNSSLKGYDLN